MLPERVGALDLGVGEAGRRFPGLDPGPPAHRHPVQPQPVVEQRAGLHVSSPRRRHLEVEPGRSQRLQVESVAVEGECLLDRDLDPLAALEQVDTHGLSLGSRAGRATFRRSRQAPSSPERPVSSAAGWPGRLRTRGHRSAAWCATAPRPSGWRRRDCELHVGDVTDAESLAGAGRGRRGRLLPRPRDGRGRRVRRARADRRAATSPGWRSARASSGSSTSAGWATRAPPSTCAAATRPRASSPRRARR